VACQDCGEANPEDVVECQSCGALLVDVFGAGADDQRTEISPPPGTFPAATSGQTARPLAPSSLFGSRYEILHLLGEGGMGRVYKARDRELDKVIALKVVRGERVDDPEAIQRFKQELLLARKVTHKNVVRIYDLGEAEGTKFFTMELIEGESLKRLIRSRGRLAWAEALPLARQILSALEEAHREGVIHRDLKPQNIIVDPQGAAHVMDFGIARAQDSTSLTATGAVMGTPDYMSPEQVRGEKADPQSDLFSFGVILYEMLSGDVPYRAETAVSKVLMRLTRKPRPLGELGLGLPKYLERVVSKCLEVEREIRYRTATEILRDLEREQVDRSLGARVRRLFARRRKLVLAAAGVGLAAAAAALLGTRTNPEPGSAEEPALTLAVLPLVNVTGAAELDWMRTGLVEMLVTDLGQSRFIRPVPLERILKVASELGLPAEARYDATHLKSISELTPAQSILYGQFVESGGRLRVDLTLRKAGSGLPLPLKVEAPASQVFALVDELTREIKQQLDLTPAQLRRDPDRPIAEVSTSSLPALRAYQAGLAELGKGAARAAIPLLRQATSEDPAFAIAFARLADAYLRAGERHQAESAIERAVALSEKAPLPLAERYHIHATAALAKDDYETAAGSYLELTKLYPEDPDVLLHLAGAYEELGKSPEAIDAYRKVVKLSPRHGAALLGLGRVLVMSGQPREAIQSLEAALGTGEFSQEPEALGMIHSILGVAYRETGNLPKAVEHLTRSLEFRRQSGDKRGEAATLWNLAGIWESRGELEKALDAYRRTLAIAREMGDRERESNALNGMGIAHWLQGRLDAALESHRQSLRIEMERGDHSNLANRLDKIANLYQLKGQYEDALVYLEQAKSHLAQSADQQEKAVNLLYTGEVRRALGQTAPALEALLAAYEIFERIHQEMGLAETRLSLAELYLHQGRFRDAQEALTQSLEVYQKAGSPFDLATAQARRGRVLAGLGLVVEAENALGEAERAARGAGGEGLEAEIERGRAELALARGRLAESARFYRAAHDRAKRNGRVEHALGCLVALGELDLLQGNLAGAERSLLLAREEAQRENLRPLEAEAAAALARLYIQKRDREASRKWGMESVALAEKYGSRLVLWKAYVGAGWVLAGLEESKQSAEYFVKAAAITEALRSGLPGAVAETFLSRPDLKDLLRRASAMSRPAP
jgi:tetratricopeptide (TPR) repeat protein/tRNA A-37 threonylcarbamoyl transferase component Bud32